VLLEVTRASVLRHYLIKAATIEPVQERKTAMEPERPCGGELFHVEDSIWHCHEFDPELVQVWRFMWYLLGQVFRWCYLVCVWAGMGRYTFVKVRKDTA
jgi:hypothetical protein